MEQLKNQDKKKYLSDNFFTVYHLIIYKIATFFSC